MAKSAKVSDDKILEEACDAFEACAEDASEIRNRTDYQDDIRFALMEDQWPTKIRQDREADKRPCLTINKLAPFIRQVVNDCRQNQPGTTVHPVDDQADPETAEIINGLIRNIEQSSNAEVAYDTALECAVAGGFGYFRVNTAYANDDTFDQDIVIDRISNPLTVYGDPASKAADSSDWEVAFVTDCMSKDKFAERWKGADAVDWDDYANLSSHWLDGDNVTIAEYWKREQTPRTIVLLDEDPTLDPQVMVGRHLAQQEFGAGGGAIIDLDVYKANKDLFDALGIRPTGQTREVKSHKVVQRLMSGAEVLETVQWAGKYIPIIPVYGSEVVIDDKRHFRSLIRSAKDAQRMFNFWRTMSTELVALAPKTPFIGAVGQFETDPNWQTANSQNHAYLEYDPKNGAPPPQRQPFAGVPAGAIQEALNAADDIKAIVGLYNPSLGAQSPETSGKAILARQHEGDVATFHFIDNLSRGIRHGGRVILDLIPHVYSVQRVIRTIGMDGKPSMARIAPGAQQAPQPGQPQPGMSPEQAPPQPMQPGMPMQMGQPPMNPQMQAQADEARKVARVYDITAGKYDLVVKVGPAYATQREEFSEMATELMRAVPPLAPVLAGPILANMDFPHAQELADKIEAMSSANQGQNPQVQAIQQQAQAVVGQLHGQLQQVGQQAQQAAQQNQQLQAQLVEMQQQLEVAQQNAALKSRELDVKSYEAETKRMEAATRAAQPSHLPGQAYETSGA